MELPLLFNRRPGVKSTHTTNEGPRRLPPPSAAAPAAPSSPVRSVIEAGLCIVGDLESEGDVLVNGQVQGNISCKALIIGPEASVAGGVVADEVVIRGKVKGVVRAGVVRLEATGRIEGDLYHNRLGIEAGAVFEGTSHNRQDPKSAETAGARQAAKLRAKAAEMMAELASEPAEPKPEPPAMLAPRPARRKSNGRKPTAALATAAALDAPAADPLPPSPIAREAQGDSDALPASPSTVDERAEKVAGSRAN
jgi:cytoskeletal protein CcmA (bactofilin family)